MKRNRVLSLFLALVLLLGLAACSSGENAPAAEEAEETETDAAESPAAEAIPAERVLVVYFSRAGEQYQVGVIEKGNTAIVAEMIAELLGADLYELRPADDVYPDTYDELTEVARQEQTAKARPAIGGVLPDLDKYDTVFLGSPVWWGDWPMIMYTYFEGADLAGKKLVPFCTNEGSGLSDLDKKLALACPYSEVARGLAIRGQDAQNRPDRVRRAVDTWLTGLGYETIEPKEDAA